MDVKEKIMADFEKAFEKVLGLEGGYANDKYDPGGETYLGVSKVHHPEMWVDGRPSFAVVQQFYQRKFWLVVGGDVIQRQDIAEEVFDTAVNCGCVLSVRWMQYAYNAMRYDWQPELVVDGIAGARTCIAVNVLCQQNETAAEALHKTMNVLQGVYYLFGKDVTRLWGVRRLCRRYGRGWMKRVEF